MQVINMKMNDVEFVGAAENHLEHADVMRKRVDTAFVEPERPGTAANQVSAGYRISTGK